MTALKDIPPKASSWLLYSLQKDNKYSFYFDSGNVFLNVHTKQSSWTIHFKYVQFIVNEVVLKIVSLLKWIFIENASKWKTCSHITLAMVEIFWSPVGHTWPPKLNHLSLAIYHLYVDNLFLEAKFNKTDFSGFQVWIYLWLFRYEFELL